MISAGLSIVIFPRWDFGWLAYFCLVPILLLVHGRKPSRLFLYFWLAGALFRLGNLYWIYHVIQHYSSLHPLVAGGIIALLCLMLGLTWAIFGYTMGRITARFHFQTAMLLAPFLWVASEWMLQLVQFPWSMFGYSQYNHPRVAQLSTIAGVYGLSWLILSTNAAIATAIVLRKYRYAQAIAVLFLCVVLYGGIQIGKQPEGPEWTVGLIQGNIPQDVKINSQFADDVNRKHIAMTEMLVQESHPDIVFWSESSTLYELQNGGEWSQQVFDLARRNHVPIVLGSDQVVGEQVYNSAFLIQSDGSVWDGTYSKMYLVPFGEFVPLQKLFFFAGKVVPEISDFSPGTTYTLFPYQDKKFAIQICFEVVFPQLARQFARRGAGVLTTITNDAWFANTSAPYQHFAMAIMRTIECRRYLIRCANTGISGFVDPYGRVLKKTDIFVPAAITGKVRWLAGETVYVKCGDILVYLSLIVFVAALALSIFHRKNQED